MFRVWVLPALALVCAVPWGAIRRVRGAPVRRAAIEALFAGYVGLLLYVVFLPLPARLDDVILNVTGACLGYLVWRAAQALARPSRA